MPAWITSELRELVCIPTWRSASRTTTSRPARASSRATPRPTTPAPMTATSADSLIDPPRATTRGSGCTGQDLSVVGARLQRHGRGSDLGTLLAQRRLEQLEVPAAQQPGGERGEGEGGDAHRDAHEDGQRRNRGEDQPGRGDADHGPAHVDGHAPA